jgi:superfamily II DNA or RNA helicase
VDRVHPPFPREGRRKPGHVVDEVHHFGCGFRDEALEMALADTRLGLTATPPRDPGHAARLDDLVGPIVYELAIGDLTGRFLASFDIVMLHVDLTDDERVHYAHLHRLFTTAYAAFRHTVPQATWAAFVRAAGRSAEGRCAVAAWREARQLLALTRAETRHAAHPARSSWHRAGAHLHGGQCKRLHDRA